MACFNYIFCILGIFFCQVCLVYSSCQDINDLSGDVSHTYTVRGSSLYQKCWTLRNPDEDAIFIQLNNISLYNRPASGGVLTLKFSSESRTFNVSSQSQLRNFTTMSSVVEIHFKVNSAHFANRMKTGFSLSFKHDCNRVLTEPKGSINSPNHPRFRGITKAECIYEIILRPGYFINITFHDIEIGLVEDCISDYLQIRDGNNEESPLIAEICGMIELYSVKSTSNCLWMKLKAGIFLNGGFFANYTAVEIAYGDCNHKDSFRCANNTCIPKSEICDGIKNCENGADELGCEYNDCNDKNNFHCSENLCIAMSEVCDGIKNCQNGADEIGCDRIVQAPTKNDGQIEDVEVITENPRSILVTSSTQDNLESGDGVQKSCPCETGTTELTKKDILKMEVKEHERRLEVIELQKEVLELQKRYEIDRIEFLKNFENERLIKLRQLEGVKIRVEEF